MIERGAVRTWVVIAALASVPIGCAARRASPGASAPSGATLPLCGVLIDRASTDDPDHTVFLVPVAPDGPAVRRYDVVNRTDHPAPLVVYAGWWLCVTEGHITAEPGADYEQLGAIEIAAFTIDQYNAERGQE